MDTENELIARSRVRAKAALAQLGHTDNVVAISEFIDRVCNSLDWALREMIDEWDEVPVVDEDGKDTGDTFSVPVTPPHDCGYHSAPDEGFCDFCESFGNAWLVSGLNDDNSAENTNG